MAIGGLSLAARLRTRGSRLFRGTSKENLSRFFGAAAIGGVATVFAACTPDGVALPDYLPLTTYTIETVSGATKLTKANVPLAAPSAVDVDGDKLPDVVVTATIADTRPLLNGKPQGSLAIVPNLEVIRSPVAVAAGKPNPPLKLEAVLTLRDRTKKQPDIVIRAGYDTSLSADPADDGKSGTIPSRFKASVLGVETGFKTLTVKADTGGIQKDRPASHPGPLEILGNVKLPTQTADLRFAFRPMPETIEATYSRAMKAKISSPGSDVSKVPTDQIRYKHTGAGEIDVATRIVFGNKDGKTNVDATMVRLPKEISLDLQDVNGVGGFAYASKTSTAKPDLVLRLKTDPKQAGDILDLSAIAEGLPDALVGTWDLADETDLSGSIRASGGSVDALEATVWNRRTAPSRFAPFVPQQDQYLSLQRSGTEDDAERLLKARVLDLRSAVFSQGVDAVDAALEAGDGETPLELSLFNQSPRARRAVRSTVSPLPGSIVARGRFENPIHFEYSSSQPARLEGTFEDVPHATLPCSEAENATCATLEAERLPAELSLDVAERAQRATRDEVQVSADVTPHLDVDEPDVRASVTKTGSSTIDPLVASVEADGIPSRLRVRNLIVDNDDEHIQRFAFHTCDWSFDEEDRSRANEEEYTGCESDGRIDRLDVQARNFLDRPSAFPVLGGAGPMFVEATVVNDMFEVSSRLRDVGSLEYVKDRHTVGMRSVAGSANGMELNVHGERGEKRDKETLDLEAAIDSVPDTMELCFGTDPSAREEALPLASFTGVCEPVEDFAPEISGDPLTFGYRSSAPFGVTGTFERLTSDVLVPDLGVVQISDLDVGFRLKNVPTEVTAAVRLAGEDSSSRAVRGLIAAPDAEDFDIALNIGSRSAIGLDPTTGGCNEHDAVATCLKLGIDDMARYASIFADPKEDASRVEFNACDWIPAATGAEASCREGTAGEIGAVTVDVRSGLNGVSIPAAPLGATSSDEQYAAVGIASDADRAAMRARARVESIERLAFAQTGTSYDVFSRAGGQGLELPVRIVMDGRADNGGQLVDGKALVEHLPSEIDLHFDQSDIDATTVARKTLNLRHRANTPTTVSSDVRVVNAGATGVCGTMGTTCVTGTVHDVPKDLTLSVQDVVTDPDIPNLVPLQFTGERIHELSASVVTDGTSKPSVDVSAALPVDTQGDAPDAVVWLDGTLEDLPRSSRIDLRERGRRDPNQRRVVKDGAIDSFTFVGCRVAGSTCPDEQLEGIGTVEIGLRSERIRPADFVAPSSEDGQYILVTSRSDAHEATAFDAAARLRSVRRLEFLRERGFTGLTSKIGTDEPLALYVDLAGIPLGASVPFDGVTLTNAEMNLKGRLALDPLPSTLNLCFREPAAKAVQGGSAPLGGGGSPPQLPAALKSCEPGITGSSKRPLTFAYRTSAPFGVDTDLAAVLTSTSGGNPSGKSFHIDAGLKTVDEQHLPEELTVHVLTPTAKDGGETRAVLLADRGRVADLDVDFKMRRGIADASDGRLVSEDKISTCSDPRPEAHATCVKGRLTSLPTNVDVRYDPALASNNLLITAANFDRPQIPGTRTGLGIEDLRLALIRPPENDVPKGIVVRGDIRDVPNSIAGDLYLPQDDKDAPKIDLRLGEQAAGSAIREGVGEIDLQATNDPTEQLVDLSIPPRDGVAEPDVHLKLRGPTFKARVHVFGLSRVQFRHVRDANERPADTMLVDVQRDDTDRDPTMRVVADVIAADGTKPTGLSDTHVLADTVLRNVPGGMSACIRPAKASTATIPELNKTFCDGLASRVANEEAVTDNVGSVLFRTTEDGLDVDSFIRIARSGGGVTAARINAEGLPTQLSGVFPTKAGGRLDLGAFKAPTGLDPHGDRFPEDSVDLIEGEVATFDISRHGYAGDAKDLPYAASRIDLLPLTPTGRAHMKVASTNGDTHILARLGPGSQLHRFRMATQTGHHDRDCPELPVDRSADYPYYPAGKGHGDAAGDNKETTYTCLHADLKQPGSADNAMDVEIDIDDGTGQRIAVKEAVLTDVPKWFQVTAATSRPLDSLGRLRTPCRSAKYAAHSADETVQHCAPPMIRFDGPSESQSNLLGLFLVGKQADVDRLGAIGFRDEIPLPKGAPSTWGANVKGIRAHIGDFGTSRRNDKRTVGHVQFKLPVPESFTLDQVQVWNEHVNAGPPDGPPGFNEYKATDLRLHYAVRPTATTNLGRGAVAVHIQETGEQLIVRGTESKFHGFVLPSELGADFYHRSRPTQLSFPEDGKPREGGLEFFQIDGRLSQPLNAHVSFAHQTGGLGYGLKFPLDLEVKNLPSSELVRDSFEPGFRAQFELIRDIDQSRPEFHEDGQQVNDPCDETRAQETGRGGLFGFNEMFIERDCVSVEGKLTNIDASIDFRPDGSAAPARLIKGVVRHRQGANGLEFVGFKDLDAQKEASFGLTGTVELDLGFLYHNAGLRMGGDLALGANVSVPNTYAFALRQKLLNLIVEHRGPEGDTGGVCPTLADGYCSVAATVGPIDVNVGGLSVWHDDFGHGAHFEHWKNVTGPLRIGFQDCRTAGEMIYETYKTIQAAQVHTDKGIHIDKYIFPQSTDHRNGTRSLIYKHRDTLGRYSAGWVLWPFNDPPYHDPRLRINNGAEGQARKQVTDMCPRFPIDDSALRHQWFNREDWVGGLPLVHTRQESRALTGFPRDPVGVTGHPVPPGESPLTTIGAPPELGQVQQLTNLEVKVDETRSLCGAHRYDEVTITGTLKIGDCGNAIPTLDIRANKITVTGTIDGRGLHTWRGPGWRPANWPTNGGGGGNAGPGGESSTGGKGGKPRYFGWEDEAGSVTDSSTEPLPGYAGDGRGVDWGQGGAGVALRATRVEISGTVDVSGDDGRTGCDQPIAVSGGGAGGTIVISGNSFVGSDTTLLRANGGRGGSGSGQGGGGGSGGVVRILSPLQSPVFGSDGKAPPHGNVPARRAVEFEAGGRDSCGDFSNRGKAGVGAFVRHSESLHSHVGQLRSFWQGSTVQVPLVVAAVNAPSGVSVDICMHAMDLDSKDESEFGLREEFMAELDGSGARCQSVKQVHFPADGGGNVRVGIDAPHFVTVEELPPGYFALTSVAKRSSSDGIPIWMDPNGLEPLPELPDIVFGVDIDDPSVQIVSPAHGVKTGASHLPLKIFPPEDAGGSGIDRMTCEHQAGSDALEFSCDHPTIHVRHGQNKILTRVWDRAGNKYEVSHTFHGDHQVPTAAFTMGPSNSEGWLKPSANAMTFSHFTDDSGPDETFKFYVYRFDDGEEHSCEGRIHHDPTQHHKCSPLESELSSLAPGTHILRWSPYDQFANVQPEYRRTGPCATDGEAERYCKVIKIDTKAPRTAFSTAPELAVDADIFHVKPAIILTAEDQPGASGVDKTWYSLDGPDDPIQHQYTGPRVLDDGDYNVCWWSVDRAGNAEAKQCRSVNVRSTSPDVTLNLADPDGADGWHRVSPTARLVSRGARVVRVDNQPVRRCAGGLQVQCTVTGLETGVHELRYGLVGSGDLWPWHSRTIKVDAEPPTLEVDIGAFAQRLSNGVFVQKPVVSVHAEDQPDGSGVASVVIKAQGLFGIDKPYTGPFELSEGQRNVCILAKDVAGNETQRCVDVHADLEEPTLTMSVVPATDDSGWFTVQPDFTLIATDSGDPFVSAAGTCEEVPVSKGVCVSIDGGDWVRTDDPGPLLEDGIHEVRAYAVDDAGRRSDVQRVDVKVDREGPVISGVRAVPRANAAGWHRIDPTATIVVHDGASGVQFDSVKFRRNSTASFEGYLNPFLVGKGRHAFEVVAFDRAGNRSSRTPNGAAVDAVGPSGNPSNKAGAAGAGKPLAFTASDELTDRIRTKVLVLDVTGGVVRTFDGPKFTISTPGKTVSGSAPWDLKDDAGKRVKPGVYHYRVVLIDEAGNSSVTGESAPMTVV